jgi:hypothetical protein
MIKEVMYLDEILIPPSTKRMAITLLNYILVVNITVRPSTQLAQKPDQAIITLSPITLHEIDHHVRPIEKCTAGPQLSVSDPTLGNPVGPRSRLVNK